MEPETKLRIRAEVRKLPAEKAALFQEKNKAPHYTEDGNTNEADIFNDGLHNKWHIHVELWGENDSLNEPARWSKKVATIVRAGQSKREITLEPDFMAVWQRWTFVEAADGKSWETIQFKPSPVFGPRTYWKDIAIFWYPNKNDPKLNDLTDLGGTVGNLPER